MACSDTFGRQMAREAKRRRFGEAKAQAFLGDGFPWNWSIGKQHFLAAVPILDFISGSRRVRPSAERSVPGHQGCPQHSRGCLDQYLAWMRGCWRGELDQVIDELNVWREKRGSPPDEAPENDPRRVLEKIANDLANNRGRMNYPDYRRKGLPVTTAWMESPATADLTTGQVARSAVAERSTGV